MTVKASAGVALSKDARRDFSAGLSLATLSPVWLKANAGSQAILEQRLQPSWSGEYGD